MDCDVEERTADQCGEPGHRLGVPFGVKSLEKSRQLVLDEVVADFDRMTGLRKAGPGSGENLAELLQGVVTGIVRELAGPDPGDAEWRFAPAFGLSAVGDFNRHADAGTGHIGDDLAAKLQRHAGVNGQEVEFRRGAADVGWLSHGLGKVSSVQGDIASNGG